MRDLALALIIFPLIIEPKLIVAIAGAIIGLMDSPNSRRALSIQGHELIRYNLIWDINAH